MNQPLNVDRRRFVLASAGMLAVIPNWKRADHVESPFRMRIKTESRPGFKKAVKIGMVQVAGSLQDKFQLLKNLGFDGVELDSPTDLSVAEVREAVIATSLEVHGVVDAEHWNKPLSHGNSAVRKEGVKALETALLECHAFGGSSVLLVPGVCNEEVSYEDAWKRSISEIKKVIPLAERIGIDILLENVWNNFLTSPAETVRYIDELGSDRIGAYFDVGNSVRYAPPAEWIQILGRKIKKLDIKEFDLELGQKGDLYAGFGVELLEGSCNWPVVIEELKKVGFTEGWGTAEIPGGDRVRLESIAQKMDRIFERSRQ